MYRAFYSLSRKPFTKEIETKHLFPSKSFTELMARLNYLKDSRGIGVVVGEPGAGKTSVLRSFALSLNPSLYKVIYFPLSTGTVMDFYRGLCYGLGEEPTFRKVDLFKQIQEGVTSLFYEKKITPVFILDEMQLSNNKFLNDLSILFNFTMDSDNPFILVLAGLPYLLDRLALSHNQSLNQRIIMRYKVTPLDKEEVKNYILHHLELAGAKFEIFSPQAVEAIATRSRGWPRLINNLATNCLLYGCQKRLECIDEEAVIKSAQEAGL